MSEEKASRNCPFCDIAAGRVDSDLVAYRDDSIFIIPTLTQRAANRGQVIILPLTHVSGLPRAEPRLLSHMFRITAAVAEAVPAVFGAVGSTVLQSTDAPDQPLDHLHVHVIPRYPGDEMVIPNPNRSPALRKQRLEIAAALREHLIVRPPVKPDQ